jgi:Tol biopolymer transport system component
VSRLVAAAVVACGCLALPAGPSDAAVVRNGPIAFGRFDPALGDFSLWTAHNDGTHQRQLTTAPSFSPNWAPDGARVAFDFPDDVGEHIATIRPDGTGQRQLTFGPGIQEVARYSPDGRLLAFDASGLLPDDPAFTTDIWVMGADGSHPRQVTRGGFDVEPVFSPDGQQIAFGRIIGPTDPNNFLQSEAVYVARTDGTGLHEVVPPRPGLEHPAWSPDGSRLIFNIAPEAQGAPGAGSIFAVNPSGAGLHVVRAASARWSFFKPVWSPDGRKLLVGCHRVTPNTDNLCVMDPDSGNLDVVVSAPPSRPVNFPSWGPKRL